jgi:DNA-binding CsgD family transcriptional regulator
VGYGFAVADVLHALGWLWLEDGGPEEARALFGEALSFAHKYNDRSLLPLILEGIAALVAPDDPTRAARLRGASAFLRAEPGWSASSIERRGAHPHSTDVASAVWQDGAPSSDQSARSLDAAIAEAAAVTGHDGADAAINARSAEAAMHAQSAYPAQLSAREVEVLRLVAHGYSNPEIAESLFLSVSTIRHHVAHILAKTDCANRAAAAAFAQRHGLA